MTILTSQKESAAPTKPEKLLDASSVSMGPDLLYQHPPPVYFQDYPNQHRHNRAWIRQCMLTWCGKAIVAISISIMLFGLIILLLSLAEGYPRPMVHDNYQDSALQRMANLERMDGESQGSNRYPIIQITPYNRFDSRENSTEVLDEEPNFFSFQRAVQAMRRRFQMALHHMRELMGNSDSLPAPAPNNNDTQIIRKINIDGTDFVQTRQVLKKELPDGEGVIVVVRQQLIPVDEFYGNGTTTVANTPAEDQNIRHS